MFTAACYLHGLLTKKGISSLVRSFHLRSLTFFFGPLVRMDLVVPGAERMGAQEIIRPESIEVA
jgi:hypothetical protein